MLKELRIFNDVERHSTVVRAAGFGLNVPGRLKSPNRGTTGQ